MEPEGKHASVAFNELPRKALHYIFASLNQLERQKFRRVCQFWKNLIDGEFLVEIIINQANFERLFKCQNASTVEIQNLKTEYIGNVAFGNRVRSIRFTGKVLSSNVLYILRCCPDLESLSFIALTQVLAIEDAESIKLPKLLQVEFRVRPDQETFTSDEIIIIGILRQIIFGRLETILINTGTPFENWEEEAEEIDYNPSELSESTGTGCFTTLKSETTSTSNESYQVEGTAALQPSLEEPREEPILVPVPVPVVDEIDSTLEPGEQGQHLPEAETPRSSGAGRMHSATTQTANTNLQVIINRAANFPDPSSSDAGPSDASTGSSSRHLRYNMSQFQTRLFLANLELLMSEGASANELSVFNDSVSQTAINSGALFQITATAAAAIKHTEFFEFVKNNHYTVKNLLVRTSADFTCFGNLNGFVKDVSRIQFEQIDYSFGRMQMVNEYALLRAQSKLKKLKLQVLDDMWKHAMIAVENSHQTLTDLDLKVLSVSEDLTNIVPISQCSNLTSLKLLLFHENKSLCQLPTSLNNLVLNGPVNYHDMESWTSQLLELENLTLILNTNGDKIDLLLYKKFLKMPKLCKLALIQCPMDLEEIREYIDNSISSRTGLNFSVIGPKEIRELPRVQYVYTAINPDQFNREQID